MSKRDMFNQSSLQKLLYKFYNLKTHLTIRSLIFRGYINDKLKPLKCCNCRSYNLEDRVTSTDGGFISEFEVVCKDCGKINGYWCHGYYQW